MGKEGAGGASEGLVKFYEYFFILMANTCPLCDPPVSCTLCCVHSSLYLRRCYALIESGYSR